MPDTSLTMGGSVSAAHGPLHPGPASDLGVERLTAGVLHFDQVDGKDETGGGANLNYTITGINVGDEIAYVVVNATKASIATRTKLAVGASGYNVSAANTIHQSGTAANQTGNQLEVVWIKRT